MIEQGPLTDNSAIFAFAKEGAQAGSDLFVVEALAGASGLYRLDRHTGQRTLIVAAPALIGVAFDPTGGLVVCSSDTAYRLPAID